MSAALRELLGLDEMVERALDCQPLAPASPARWWQLIGMVCGGKLDSDVMRTVLTAAGVPALLADAERSHIMALDMATKASTAEAALLAKSAAYDALVARVEAAPWGYVAGEYHGAEHGGIIVMDYVRAPVGQRVRLLVSDDRPSTVGEK